MVKESLHIAIIQANLVWENSNQNRLLFAKKINTINHEVDVIVLPELFTTGFTKNINLAETMNGETVLWMQNLARKKKAALVGSLIIKEHSNYYNRLLFVHPNGDINCYDKRHLFTLSGEDKVFTAGDKILIVAYKGWKICPLICYDLRFPTWSNNTYNYDVLLYVASWPQKRITAWDALLKARAIENMSYTIGVNRVGQDGNGFSYIGNSVVIDALGTIVSTITANKEQTEIIPLPYQKQDNLRQQLGFLNDI